ncbi:MAG: hypothetical protein ACOYKZ_06550 [Chlamydiia bacterium]
MFSSKTKRIFSLAMSSLALSLTTSGAAYSCSGGLTIHTAFTSAKPGQLGQQSRGWYSLFSKHAPSNLSYGETKDMAAKLSLSSCSPAGTAQSDVVALLLTPEFASSWPSSAYPCAQAEIYNGLVAGNLAYKAWLGKAPLLPNSLDKIQTLTDMALIGQIKAQQSAYADACATAFCSALGGQTLTVGVAQSISKGIYSPAVNLTSAPAGQNDPIPGGTGYCDPAMPKQNK